MVLRGHGSTGIGISKYVYVHLKNRASVVELGYSREGSLRVPLLPDGAVPVSSGQRQRRGGLSDALQLGACAAPSTISSGGAGGAQPASPSSLGTVPGLPCPPRHHPHYQSDNVSYGKPGLSAALRPTGKRPHGARPPDPQALLPSAPAPASVLVGGVRPSTLG